MIAKTLSGIPAVDGPLGGVFSNRCFLVCGPKQSGKTISGLHFIRQGLEQNERCLYLSTMSASDLSICSSSLGFDLSASIDSSDLTLLEYESILNGGGIPGPDMLPPDGFEQLRDIILTNSVERVVLDTVLPWVSVKQPDRMPEQIFSFTRSFDRLGVTTMLTLPKPASSMAFRLKKALEDVVPISILLEPEEDARPARMQVVKYLGEKKLGGKMNYDISTGKIITGTPPPPEQDEVRPAVKYSGLDSAPPPRVQRRVRFSGAHMELSAHSAQSGTNSGEIKSSDAPSAQTDPSPGTGSEDAAPQPDSKSARLSEIWQAQPAKEPQE